MNISSSEENNDESQEKTPENDNEKFHPKAKIGKRMEPIILASSSPRRQEILKMLKITFRVIAPNIDETISSLLDQF